MSVSGDMANSDSKRVMDSTECKREEQALSASEIRYRRLFESAKDGILILDAETGMVVDVNPFLIQLLGFSREEFLGKEIWELGFFKDIIANQDNFSELQQQKYIRYEDKPLQTADGRRVDVEFVSNVYLANDVKVIQCNIRDITERKRTETDLARNNNTQAAMNALLSLTMEHMSVTEFLEKALNLVLSLKWLVFESKGCVFLADKAGKTLHLVAQQGLSETILTMCRDIPFGRCLCGRAAAERTIQFADCLDDRHEVRFEGIAQHGHCCVPILSCDRILGVLNFYVRDGHVRDQKEEEFLKAIADTMGGVIERKLAEAELRKLYRAVEQSPATVAITDVHGTIEYVNPKFVETTGYAREEAIGQNPSVLKSGTHPPLFYTELWRTIRAGNVWHGEFCNKKKNGEIYFESAAIAPVRDEQGQITHFVAIKEDITGQRRIADELRNAKDAAETANRAKSDFLSSMSHELRTPLNAVIGFSEVLADKTFGELNEKQGKYVDNVLGAGRHLLSLINDILDLSKVESGKMELELSTFHLATVLNNSLVMVKEKCMKQGIALSLDIKEPILDHEISADERKLKQILFNLLSNAVKFTPEGGSITVSARLEASMGVSEYGSKGVDVGAPIDRGDPEKESPERSRAPTTEKENCDNFKSGLDRAGQSTLLISVADTGIGIKLEDQERIFREFEQVDSSYTRKYQGTGLGLTLVKRFVELHGGRVWVESPSPPLPPSHGSSGEASRAGEVGKGSTFWFTIPIGQRRKKC